MIQPEDRVHQALIRLSGSVEYIEIDPAYADTAAFCEHYGYPPEQSANTILVASKRGPKQHAACVVLSTHRLDVNHRVRGLMGVSRLSFASAEEMREVTGMEVGGLTPFGLPPSMPLYIDSDVMDRDWVIVGGGGRSLKLKLAPQTLLELPGAQVIDGLGIEER